MSSADRLRDIQRVWSAVVDLQRAERRALLDQLCREDAELRREVESLLVESDRMSAGFLERPAIEEVAAGHAAAREALIGQDIGGYRIERLLGTGGMGDVYQALELRLARRVALKVLSRVATSEAERIRFEEEARAASCLNHPNIVTIHAVGEADGITYIAMELVSGRTLRPIIDEHPPLHQAIDYAVQLGEALAAAHAAGIVHRDLKPENVMITTDGRVKVLDFGIAKRDVAVAPDISSLEPPQTRRLTEHGVIIGTVEYMSPEQATGGPVDFRSDQFSFGAILYELVSGRPAFARASRTETLGAIATARPDLPTGFTSKIPSALRNVINRCLEKAVSHRFGRTDDLVGELRSIREGVIDPRAAGLTRRRAIGVGAAATVALAAGLLSRRFLHDEPTVRTVAVLPFENSQADENIDYLCDGLTESLIRRLSYGSTVKVIAFSAVTHFRSAGATEAGGQLHADAVVTGTVMRRAGRLIVSAELVETGTGARLWGDVFDRQADVLAVQDEIAGAMTAAIRIRFDPGPQEHLARMLTSNAHAYDLYLQAVHHLRLETEDDYLTARDLLKRVVEESPDFALAYVTLASTYSVAAIDGYEPPTAAWPHSRSNIDRALALDRDLPDAHAEATAVAFYYDWNWDAAEREWNAAVQSRRSEVQPELLTLNALQKWALGRNGEALEFARAARLADPLSAACALREADLLARMNRLDDAAGIYEQVIHSSPDDPRAYYGLADVRQTQGRFDEGITLRRRVHKDGVSESLDAVFEEAHGIAGYRSIEQADARLELAQLRVTSDAGLYVSPLDYARIYARLGDSDRAFSYFPQAFEERAAGLVFLNVDPAWDRLRADSRFREAVRMVGLPVRSTV
jgi:serine/threonine protein kinase/tetratricopeptide (TPR) repeat protein